MIVDGAIAVVIADVAIAGANAVFIHQQWLLLLLLLSLLSL